VHRIAGLINLTSTSPWVSQWWNKENVKFSLSTPGRYIGGGEVQIHSFNFGTRWRGITRFTPWPLYTTGKEPWYPLILGLVGYAAGTDILKGKIYCPYQESNHESCCTQPSLYTDYTILAPSDGKGLHKYPVIVCQDNKKILCFKLYHHLQCNNDKKKDGTQRQHCCVF